MHIVKSCGQDQFSSGSFNLEAIQNCQYCNLPRTEIVLSDDKVCTLSRILIESHWLLIFHELGDESVLFVLMMVVEQNYLRDISHHIRERAKD